MARCTSTPARSRQPATVLDGSTLADRAPIFAVVYLLSYSGATIPSLISAQLSSVLPLTHIALGYCALALLCTLFVVVSAHNPYTETANSGQLGQLSNGRARNG